MAKILVLAPSGFGKSTSLGKIPQYEIQGLNPEETFVITATSKPLPFKGSGSLYKACDITKPPTKENGNRLISNNGETVAKAIDYIAANRPDIKNVVLDDSNYIMQDYYMANAKKKGYDVFKELGMMMDKIFTAAENMHDKHFIMMAHYEEYKTSTDDTISYRFKTVG